MTKEGIRKKISYNENQIGSYKDAISKKETQIVNLENLKRKFNTLLYEFNCKHNTQNTRISELNNLNYINSKIVNKYTSAMNGLVNGYEYRKACNEIYRAIDVINNQIRKLEIQIQSDHEAINKYSGNIDYWNRQMLNTNK